MKDINNRVQITFRNTDKNTMEVNCFDEDTEMWITIMKNGRKCNYAMTYDEVKTLRSYLNRNLKNNKDNDL